MKNTMITIYLTLAVALAGALTGCGDDRKEDDVPPANVEFYFGADLSYVNQILDRGGVYKDNSEVRSPYRIFKDHGTGLVRLRLWHNPAWTRDVYSPPGTQLYNNLTDVEKAIRLSKAEGMQVLLDFHYSDAWADPGKQEIPKAWVNIRDISVLRDSVYQYTLKTLNYLKSKDLMPELVQIGNEINCGMFTTTPPAGFPTCNACNNEWGKLGEVLNAGISAVRDVSTNASIKSKVLLHVADPKNLDWWFDNIKGPGKVSDFDMIGFSYYPLWHTTVPIGELQSTVARLKGKYQKPLIILETAYPWSTQNNDSYGNIFGSQTPVPGYPFTKNGQYEMMKTMTQAMVDAGGSGIVYWEPAWITSEARDLWGKGSSWENNTFFDFSGNTMSSIDFMKFNYTKK